jgi:DNA-binding CsgD family transcriptional regulator
MTGPAPQPRVVVLTPQQRKTIGQLTHDGASDAAIAARMGLSTWTVNRHLTAAVKRTGARSRVQLVVWLMKRQVVIRTENRSGRPRKSPADTPRRTL